MESDLRDTPPHRNSTNPFTCYICYFQSTMVSNSNFFAVAATAGILALADRAAAQPGEMQVASLGPGYVLAEPSAPNAAADQVADPSAPAQVLQQQGIEATRLFSRTCPCVPRTDAEIVRPLPFDCYQAGMRAAVHVTIPCVCFFTEKAMNRTFLGTCTGRAAMPALESRYNRLHGSV